MGHDEFHRQDGAYVLGALSPEERQRYEEHLAGCPDCREEVRGLVGLPGLLSRVPVEEIDTTPVEPPPTLLPGLLATAARRRRRTRWLIASGGAVAAAICLVLALLLTVTPGTGERGRPMAALAPAPVTATVALRSQPWGTDVTLRCRYTGPADYAGGYVLVVLDTAGHVDRISTWSAVPDTTAVLTGTTASRPEQIRAIQVRTGAGTPVLTMRP